MGRYRSSPQCSKCWQQGHTKAHCPTYRAKAEKWLAENPDAEQYNKPYWVREQEEYKNIAKNRKCSWCDEQGHNKRSCPEKKKVLNKNIAKNKEWRQQILDKMKEIGLGTGALLARKDNYGGPKTLWFVKGIKWDVLNLRSSGNAVCYNDYHKSAYKDGQVYPQCIQTVRVSDGKEGVIYAPNFKDEGGETLFYHADDRNTVVSESVPSPPTGWVDDESWAKKLF